MNIFRTIAYRAIKLQRKCQRAVRYCSTSVWQEEKKSWWVNVIKTLNLTVRSFTNKQLQQRAGSLTYHTVLAVVPGLAMLFAIGRGFGFQNLLQSELFKFFPAQQEALKEAFTFVDGYLSQTSQGLFVGIGIVVLLWTLISLMGNVEDAFNYVWNVRKGRNFYRKITVYTTLFVLLPILMICSAGISIFMSNAVQESVRLDFLSPFLLKLLDYTPLFISWLIFTAAFWLIPNTKVKFKYALISGFVCGTAFYLLQWLFVSGQIYVAKYNAIYGSFAFLPLLLLWIYLSWMIAMIGVGLTYSMQNYVNYSYHDDIKHISGNYLDDVTLVTLAVIVNRFQNKQQPCSANMLTRFYNMPAELTAKVLNRLKDAKLISVLQSEEDDDRFQPAFNIDEMTVNSVRKALDSAGKSHFAKKVDTRFAHAIEQLHQLHQQQTLAGDLLIKDLLPNE